MQRSDRQSQLGTRRIRIAGSPEECVDDACMRNCACLLAVQAAERVPACLEVNSRNRIQLDCAAPVLQLGCAEAAHALNFISLTAHLEIPNPLMPVCVFTWQVSTRLKFMYL